MNEIKLLIRTGQQDEAVTLLRQRPHLVDSRVTGWPLAECMIRHFTGSVDLIQDVAQRALAMLGPTLSWHQESIAVAFMARERRELDIPLSSRAMKLHDDAVGFYEAYPLRTELALADSWSRSQRFLDHKAVDATIAASLAANEPLSIVRLGDGEGRLVGELSPYPSLLADTAAIAQRVWFWNSPETSLESIREDVRWAVRASDVVGVNSPFRLEFEYRNSFYGYAGAVLANRFVADATAENVALAWNHLSVELDRSGALARLAGAADSFGLVSPYMSVEPLTAWSGGRCEFLRVPSEGHPLLAESSLQTPHFPDVYEGLRARLRSGAGPGCLLVAAGAFGKVYCAEAKRGGGIAVDIGSVADNWAGFRTR